MSAVSSAGLRELHEAAASPLARPSAAQLLPGAQAAEGISRLERLAVFGRAQGAARTGGRGGGSGEGRRQARAAPPPVVGGARRGSRQAVAGPRRAGPG